MHSIIGRLPTIPEYYQLYINKDVDLTVAPKQCCPFHKEDMPSFSYSAEKNKWRCFGSCKVGGDVIALHQKNYGLSSREEAERSLNAIHKVYKRVTLNMMERVIQVNENKIDNEVIYQEALMLANNPDRWIELDYIMSKTPVDFLELKDLVSKWR